MAILDRPMFQRRLTKDQLRAYGIPAFANGGVVQKFAEGPGPEGVTKLPFMPDPSEESITSTQLRNSELPPVGTVIKDEIVLDEETGIKTRIREVVVAGARGIPRIQKTEEVVFKPATTVKTPRGDKIIPAVGEDAPVGDLNIETKKDETQEETPEVIEDDITKEQDEIARLKTLALERSALYKDMLGDPKEMMRQQGLLQLAQFGLNLASARGGNIAEKIATSATDPLRAFAQLANDASKDARAIDLAAIKSAEDQLQTEIEIAGKTDELEKVLIYTKSKESNPGNPLGAATTTGILPKSEITEINVYRDEQGINKKLFNQGGGANQIFQGEDGKIYKVEESALKNKSKYLYFKYPDNPDKSDFIEIQGVEILER